MYIYILFYCSVVKRPGTSVPSRYKKMKTSRYQIFLKWGYRWYRGPGQPGSWRVGPYDFRDEENADEISEPSLKT